MATTSVSENRTAAPSALSRPQTAWFGGLLIVCYAPLLWGLMHQWATAEDMSHGFFVPTVSGFIVWQRRSEIVALRARPNYWGLALAAWGAVQMILGTLAAQLFIARTAFLVSLTGVLLYLGGMQLMKAVAFPLSLLAFMFPIPAILYARLTLPLQVLASSIAESILNALRVPVVREGNILELASQKLSVVEACSGIRSLLSLAFLALVYAYFFDRRVWVRWALLGATVPIAIAANAARVTLMGLIGEYRIDLARGFMHLAEGWVLFVIALGLVVLLHRCLPKS